MSSGGAGTRRHPQHGCRIWCRVRRRTCSTSPTTAGSPWDGGLKALVVAYPVLALKWGMRRLALQTSIQTALAEFDAADKATTDKMDRINLGLVK